MRNTINDALIAVMNMAEENGLSVYFLFNDWCMRAVGYGGDSYGDVTLEQVLRKAHDGWQEHYTWLSNLVQSFPVTLLVDTKTDIVKFLTWIMSRGLRFDYDCGSSITIYWKLRSTSFPKDYVAGKLYTQMKEELSKLNNILTAVEAVITEYYPERV